MKNEKLVALDADFLNSVLVDDGLVFISLMKSLDVVPVVHCFVANQELFGNSLADKLIKNETIKVVNYDDFLEDNYTRILYDINFRKIYQNVNGESLPNSVSIYDESFHISGKNAGEILTELMCKEMRIPLFASNDWGAKKYAKIYINSSDYQLDVKNLIDILRIVGTRVNDLSWKMVKRLLSTDNLKQYKDEIRRMWIHE